MQIKIRRTHTTRLYTMGTLIINDMKTTHTVEDTLSMLDPGNYQIRLHKGNSRRRVIAIIPDNRTSIYVQPAHRFEAGGTYLSSRRNKSIGIGELLIPGSLMKGNEVYDRLFDRLEKAEARKEAITLLITDDGITHGDPIGYWTAPSNHGCPPTKRHVEHNSDGSVDIYDGSVHLKHLTIEEQRALREPNA